MRLKMRRSNSDKSFSLNNLHKLF